MSLRPLQADSHQSGAGKKSNTDLSRPGSPAAAEEREKAPIMDMPPSFYQADMDKWEKKFANASNNR